MDATPSFSERLGLSRPPCPITVRNDAPPELRSAIVTIALKSGFGPDNIRSIVCHVLDETPNTSQNWSSPNIIAESQGLILACEWFETYDICEEFAKRRPSFLSQAETFEEKLNRFFEKKGIGWKMENGQLSARGEGDYEKTVSEAQTSLEESGRPTAAEQLKEALRDISRRPEPDVTGAVQHSMAALECLAKDLSGESGKTLGSLISELQLPRPVDDAVEKMWGFSSNQGRHIAEGKKPDFPEAMLTVHFCSALISYLSQRKWPNHSL